MQCACVILSSVTYPALKYFSSLPHKRHDFKKKNVTLNKIYVLIFSKTFSETFLILRRNERDILCVYWSTCKVPDILVKF